MKKVLTWLAIMVLVIGGAIIVFKPNNHFRLYDANLRALALTEAEAYCVGFNLTQPILDSPQEGVKECILTSKKETHPSIADTITYTCEGVSASWEMPADACVEAMEGYDLWPLLEGGFTLTWNDAWPRPAAIEETLTNIVPPRSGERDAENRTEE